MIPLIIVSLSLTLPNALKWECPEDTSLCLPGVRHKESASPETDDYAACLDYQESSCCTANFTQNLATSDVTHIDDGVSIFNWTKCGALSDECEAFFIEIECFYRCSPNMIYFAAEWESSVNRLPICGQYCDHWYDACFQDLTCATNWITDWYYDNTTGQNECSPTSTCTTFGSRFDDGEDLCNTLWWNTFNYTSETDLCLTPNYYAVNTLVVEEIFADECGYDDTTIITEEDDTAMIIGIILMVIGVLCCIGAVIYFRMKSNKGQATVN